MLHHGTNTTLPISRGKIDLLSASLASCLFTKGDNNKNSKFAKENARK